MVQFKGEFEEAKEVIRIRKKKRPNNTMGKINMTNTDLQT